MKITKYTINHFIIMGSILVATFGTSSCKKERLDLKPDNQINEEDAYSTEARILIQVNGLYASLKSGQHRGGRFLIYNDIRAEEFVNNRNNGVTGYQTWQCNLTSSTNEVENLWTAVYLTINRTNIFLKRVEENSSVLNPSLLKEYKAEAKLIRALCYFDLLTLYAKPYKLTNGTSLGLPLRLNAENNTQNNNLARSSVADVYKQIIEDLNTAESDLPSTYSDATLRVTRAHKNTAIALKTRVYLSMGDYANVVNEAKKIVPAVAPFQSATGVAHALQADVTTVFSNYLTTESIFSMPMTNDNPPGTQNQLGYYYTATNGGNAEYFLNNKPGGIFMETTWPATDKRKSMLVVSGGKNYVTKFKGPSPFTDYVPVVRYAEVLLNYAEALAQTGNLSLSFDLLKAIRNRSDAAYTFPASTNADATSLTNAILIERRIELLCEGFRAIDLLRLGLPIPKKDVINQVNPTDASYIWPIPNSEMVSNKLMVQN